MLFQNSVVDYRMCSFVVYNPLSDLLSNRTCAGKSIFIQHLGVDDRVHHPLWSSNANGTSLESTMSTR